MIYLCFDARFELDHMKVRNSALPGMLPRLQQIALIRLVDFEIFKATQLGQKFGFPSIDGFCFLNGKKGEVAGGRQKTVNCEQREQHENFNHG